MQILQRFFTILYDELVAPRLFLTQAAVETAPISIFQLIQAHTKFVRERFAELVFPEFLERRDLLERLVNTDVLTGLANRRSFDLAQSAAEADSNQSFIVFDANNFGLANKTKGHAFGDQLLQLIARALTDAAGQFGYQTRVFRYAGDEFVVICPTRVALIVRDDAENFFGVHPLLDRTYVSISGAIGSTFDGADALLQERKRARKEKWYVS